MNLRPRQVDFDQSWKDLRKTVEQIVNLQRVERITWDYNFSDIYFICVSIPESQAHRLFNALGDCLKEHIQKILMDLQKIHSDDLLKEYNKEWYKYHKGSKYLQNLFGYLNKQLAKERNDSENQQMFLPMDTEVFSLRSVGNMVLDIWKEQLLRPLSVKLTPFIIRIIAKDRDENGNIDASQAQCAVTSLVDVNEPFDEDLRSPKVTTSSIELLTSFYQEIFEVQFVKETINYYRSLASDVFVSLNCSQYMEKVLYKMEEEKSRARRFLHPSSITKVDHLCSLHLVQAQIDRFSSVCGELIKKEQLKDLRNMHILLKPLDNGLSFLLSEFEAYIRCEGMQMVTSCGTDAAQLVSNIQALHEKFSNMVTDVFREDGEFVSAVDRALQHIVNHREDPKQPPKISERLNRFVDGLLRKSGKGMNEPDIDSALTKAITIFRYIDDKDLFQKYYSKMLSNRLIANLSNSMDFEESMITKMKEACGYEFTNKLSRMFTDIGLSRSLNERFLEFLSVNDLNVETPVYVMVLQAGAWPLSAQATNSETQNNASTSATSNCTTFTVPTMLQDSLTYFEKFYDENHTGRKLTWLYGNSTVDVKFTYLDKPYLVSMNVYQLSILLLFMKKDTVFMKAIIECVDLPTPIVLKCIKGFVDCGIFKTESLRLDESSILNLNLQMTSKRTRFKIITPQMTRPQEKEVDATCNTLQQDRKYYTECAIVRIMKARKLLKHSALVDEVIKQTSTRFVPDVSFIKKNIESLIEKLYLQRTDQHDEYQYLA